MVKWQGSRDRVIANRSGSLHSLFRNIPLARRHMRWTYGEESTAVSIPT